MVWCGVPTGSSRWEGECQNGNTNADTSKAERELKDDAHHSQRESQQVPASLEVTPRPASVPSPHTVQPPFKLPLLCEVTGQVSQFMSPLRAGSPFPTALWFFLDINPVGFQSQSFVGSSLWHRSWGFGMPDGEHKPLTLQGKAPYSFETSPTCGLPYLRWGFWWDQVSAPPTPLNVALLSFVVDALFS